MGYSPQQGLYIDITRMAEDGLQSPARPLHLYNPYGRGWVTVPSKGLYIDITPYGRKWVRVSRQGLYVDITPYGRGWVRISSKASTSI